MKHSGQQLVFQVRLRGTRHQIAEALDRFVQLLRYDGFEHAALLIEEDSGKAQVALEDDGE